MRFPSRPTGPIANRCSERRHDLVDARMEANDRPGISPEVRPRLRNSDEARACQYSSRNRGRLTSILQNRATVGPRHRAGIVVLSIFQMHESYGRYFFTK